MHGFPHGKRANEIGCLREPAIGAIGGDISSRLVSLDELEYVTQSRPGPFRIADCAAPPLDARHARTKKAARISGALEGSGDSRLGKPRQIRERERLAIPGASGNSYLKRILVDARARQMLAHEEDIIGSEPALKVLSRCLQVLRKIVVDQHGTLAGNRDDLAGSSESRRGRQASQSAAARNATQSGRLHWCMMPRHSHIMARSIECSTRHAIS
jgi:hypothetical protein